MKKTIKHGYAIIITSMLAAGCSSHNNDTSNDAYSNSRSIDHVRWHKSKSLDAETVSTKTIPQNRSRAFFYRKDDKADVQTSINIGLNGRFQTSVQSDHYSQILTCTGLNELGAMVTARKNNSLRGIEGKGEGVFTGVKMLPARNYYFEVNLTPNGKAAISETNEQEALQAMSEMKHQNHQISRVVPICAQAPARIKLAVFFDTAKYNVKQKYYEEIERVATYMKKYKNTKVVIEGHTDNRASVRYNQVLSSNRAKAVAAVLVSKFGIAQNRVSSIGFGESRPVATNKTRVGRQENRRVIASFSISSN
ncbi:MAG: OmpA family protein [Gammaproteobacteria bacterium]|nr:OmpA family protein [Gammaproteobacteria bacterium]